MIRLLLLPLLMLSSALAQDTTTAFHVRRRNDAGHSEVQHWRRLSSSEDNQNSNDDDAYNNDDTNMFYQAKDRFGEDFISMWSSPPNEWSEEYWEVLGVVLSFMFLSLCCCLSCCFLPLWSPRDEPKAPKTLLSSDLMNDNGLEPGSPDNPTTKDNDVINSKDTEVGPVEPMILEGPPRFEEQPDWDPSKSPTQSKADEPSALQPAPFDKILSYDTDASGYHNMETDGGPRKKKRKSLWSQRVAVWNEVVSAWSEFLGCSDESQDQAYSKYKEPTLATSLRKKSSAPRKSKAPRNYRAPSLRRKSDIEFEAAVSSNKQHKVEKYDGMVV